MNNPSHFTTYKVMNQVLNSNFRSTIINMNKQGLIKKITTIHNSYHIASITSLKFMKLGSCGCSCIHGSFCIKSPLKRQTIHTIHPKTKRKRFQKEPMSKMKLQIYNLKLILKNQIRRVSWMKIFYESRFSYLQCKLSHEIGVKTSRLNPNMKEGKREVKKCKKSLVNLWYCRKIQTLHIKKERKEKNEKAKLWNKIIKRNQVSKKSMKKNKKMALKHFPKD